MIVAARVCKRPASLAIAIVAALLGAAIVVRLGADASAWEDCDGVGRRGGEAPPFV